MYARHMNVHTAISTQTGVALVMAMAFLLILTLLGVTVMSTTALEERMASNMSDKNLSLQAAESGLLAGEDWIRNQTTRPVFTPPQPGDGLHLPSTGVAPVWLSGVWNSDDVFNYAGLNGVNTQPKYIIEYMGKVPTGKSKTTGGGYGAAANPEKDVYRITANGTGATDQAMSMTQSTYERLY